MSPEAKSIDCPHGHVGDLAPLREGVCPRCGLSLERRDDHGWCCCCLTGWSTAGDTVTVHLGLSGVCVQSTVDPGDQTMSTEPSTHVERSGPTSWSWKISHPRHADLPSAQRPPLLTGTAPTRRRAQAHATRAAEHWTRQYGHLLDR